jgi:hypothetical protein
MAGIESIEEMQAKLETYRGQLTQVSALLASDPSNEQFQKLNNDLMALVSITEGQLLQFDEKEESSEHKAEPEVASSDVNVTIGTNNSSMNSNTNTANDSHSIPIAPAADPGGYVGPIIMNDIVLVSGGERPYAGYVTGIVTNPALEGGTGLRIKYYEYDTEVELPLSVVSRLPPGPMNSNRLALAASSAPGCGSSSSSSSSSSGSVGGWKGQCKYGVDQLYYNVNILELTPYGAKVVYPQFGNIEEVPLAYLRPNKEKSTASASLSLSSSSSSNNGNQGISSGTETIEIPLKYQIKDTDTEEERKYKLKKIKNIKAKNREMTKETEVAAVQKSWQTFVSKSNKRGLSGAPKSTSMFSSNNNKSSSAGTGTGTGTEFQAKKQRHKFDYSNET